MQEIYQAFGRGDIPAILERMADSVEWEYGAEPSGVPWLEPGHRKAQAEKFFQSLAALEFHKFLPKAFLEGPGIVVSLVDVEATVKETGKQISKEDEVHIWHFNPQGLIIRFRHRVDTLQHFNSYQQ